MARPQFKCREPSEVRNHLASEYNGLAQSPSIGKHQDMKEEVPWSIKHEPSNLKDVAMHPAKLAEIESALLPSSQTRVLVLSGPSGSSKSTATRLIAQGRAQNIVEFHAPEASIGTTSLMNTFHEFLLGAAMHSRERTLVLIEDLPSLFHESTRELFEEALIQWSQEPHQPIVALCMTEIEVSAKYSEAIVVPRVLGNLTGSAKRGGEVVWLKSNPLNATILQKKVQAVALKEGLKLSKTFLKSLCQCGDIRSSLNALEFYAKTSNSTELEIPVGAICVRGTPIELFYAIGKVVWTSSKKGSLEESLEGFQDTMDNFNLTVLENYTSAKHQGLTIQAASEAAEWLSIADVCPSSKDLGALGTAHAIAESNARDDCPRKFVQTRYTQFPKWQSMRFQEQAKLHRSIISLSMRNISTTRQAFLDCKAYASNFPSKPTPPYYSDSEEDDDF